MKTLHLVSYTLDGRIWTTASGPEDTVERTLRLNTALPYVVSDVPVTTDLFYVVDGQIVSRPPGVAALDGLTLTGVLAGSTITIEGVDYTADGDDIHLEFEYPGTYKVKVTAWPRRDQEFIVENPA